MADNIDRLKSIGAQKYLNYDLIGSPFTVQGLAIGNNLNMITSASEYKKISFMYPSLRMIDPQNQYDKTVVHQQKGQLVEFKLDIEANCLVTQFFLFLQYRNSNTDVTKNITHTSPMLNVERVSLVLNNQPKKSTKKKKKDQNIR